MDSWSTDFADRPEEQLQAIALDGIDFPFFGVAEAARRI